MAGNFNKYAGGDKIGFSDFMEVANTPASLPKNRLKMFNESLETQNDDRKSQMLFDATHESLIDGLSTCLRYIGMCEQKLALDQSLDVAEYCDLSRELFSNLKDKCENDFYPISDEEIRKYNKHEKNIISLASKCLDSDDRIRFSEEVKNRVGENSSLVFLLGKIAVADNAPSEPEIGL